MVDQLKPGARGFWSGDEVNPRPRSPGWRARIFFQVDVPHCAAVFDANQARPGDPHIWDVQVHDAQGWHEATGVQVSNPDDHMGVILQLLTALREQ